jgi:hypothetical protein
LVSWGPSQPDPAPYLFDYCRRRGWRYWAVGIFELCVIAGELPALRRTDRLDGYVKELRKIEDVRNKITRHERALRNAWLEAEALNQRSVT